MKKKRDQIALNSPPSMLGGYSTMVHVSLPGFLQPSTNMETCQGLQEPKITKEVQPQAQRYLLGFRDTPALEGAMTLEIHL